MNGLFAGRAGIASHGTAIAALADNIANSNTVGFKSTRAEFQDLLAGNLSGSVAPTVGSGSGVSAITSVFTQGTFESTGRSLDVAIDGQGFFVLSDNGTRYYSRAGNFKLDEDGYLLNQNGLQVMGFAPSGAGGLQPLNVNSVTQMAQKSTKVVLNGNLNADAQPTTMTNPPTWATLANEASYSTTVEMYDSLGAQHTVNLFFFKGATQGEWEVNAFIDSSEVGTTGSGDPVLLGTATMQFDGNGAIIGTADITVDPSTAGGWRNGASANTVDIAFEPFTQYATSSNISVVTQDGRGAGSVTAFSIEADGTFNAVLDNGQSCSIGKIALATFSNIEGLIRTGGSLYAQSMSSGEAVIGTPQSGKFGGLQSEALELSTSDLAGDFIKLVTLQRGFQGSSRVITSIDTLLSEIINIIR